MAEYMTVAAAGAYLGASRNKMAALIKKGVLKTYPDPLDGRVKAVKRQDVEKLKKISPKHSA